MAAFNNTDEQGAFVNPMARGNQVNAPVYGNDTQADPSAIFQALSGLGINPDNATSILDSLQGLGAGERPVDKGARSQDGHVDQGFSPVELTGHVLLCGHPFFG